MAAAGLGDVEGPLVDRAAGDGAFDPRVAGEGVEVGEIPDAPGGDDRQALAAASSAVASTLTPAPMPSRAMSV